MKKKVVIVLVLFAVCLSGYIYVMKVTIKDPKSCTLCHFIQPYFKKWETSSHKMVPCLSCHEYTAERALAAQFLFLAGAYNPRPLTVVPDSRCLQAGCHDRRLIESKVIFSKRSISFDHKTHFTESRRGVQLHCRSCHGDIVQGEHLKVSMNPCYLCHFKDAAHDQAFTGCPSCHSAPRATIVAQGKSFSHAEAIKAGRKCEECHQGVTKGEGTTPKDKCFFCHVDRTEKYADVQILHAKHVGEKQIQCLWCHEKIEHGKLKIADSSLPKK
jgi:hypothetical protein